MFPWRRASLGLIIPSLLLASCGGGPVAAPLILGNPSLNISVPLNIAACSGDGTCYALGTTGLDISPTAAAQDSSDGSSWQVVSTPNSPSTQITSAGCWRIGCYFGGSNANGDVLWMSSSGSPITLQPTTHGGLGVVAMSCGGSNFCAVVDVGANGSARISFTSLDLPAWSTPKLISWPAITTALSLACTSATQCVVSGTERFGPDDHAVWATTADAGRSWSVNSWTGQHNANAWAWTQITNINCAGSKCFALATLQDGANVVIVSGDHGNSWYLAVHQPSSQPGSLACTPKLHCVAVGTSKVWLATWDGKSWSDTPLKYVPDPFVAVGCSLRQCVAIDSQTTVLAKV